MKKSELISQVAQKSGLSKKDVKAVIDATLQTIQEALKDGEKITFVGFGSFEVVTRAARIARVPATNKKIKVPETKSVKFKVGKTLKEFINK